MPMETMAVYRLQAVRFDRQLLDFLMIVVAEHDTKLLRQPLEEMEGEKFISLLPSQAQL